VRGPLALCSDLAHPPSIAPCEMAVVSDAWRRSFAQSPEQVACLKRVGAPQIRHVRVSIFGAARIATRCTADAASNTNNTSCASLSVVYVGLAPEIVALAPSVLG
jgi:hypothetical protein